MTKWHYYSCDISFEWKMCKFSIEIRKKYRSRTDTHTHIHTDIVWFSNLMTQCALLVCICNKHLNVPNRFFVGFFFHFTGNAWTQFPLRWCTNERNNCSTINAIINENEPDSLNWETKCSYSKRKNSVRSTTKWIN